MTKNIKNQFRRDFVRNVSLGLAALTLPNWRWGSLPPKSNSTIIHFPESLSADFLLASHFEEISGAIFSALGQESESHYQIQRSPEMEAVVGLLRQQKVQNVLVVTDSWLGQINRHLLAWEHLSKSQKTEKLGEVEERLGLKVTHLARIDRQGLRFFMHDLSGKDLNRMTFATGMGLKPWFDRQGLANQVRRSAFYLSGTNVSMDIRAGSLNNEQVQWLKARFPEVRGNRESSRPTHLFAVTTVPSFKANSLDQALTENKLKALEQTLSQQAARWCEDLTKGRSFSFGQQGFAGYHNFMKTEMIPQFLAQNFQAPKIRV